MTRSEFRQQMKEKAVAVAVKHQLTMAIDMCIDGVSAEEIEGAIDIFEEHNATAIVEFLATIDRWIDAEFPNTPR